MLSLAGISLLNFIRGLFHAILLTTTSEENRGDVIWFGVDSKKPDPTKPALAYKRDNKGGLFFAVIPGSICCQLWHKGTAALLDSVQPKDWTYIPLILPAFLDTYKMGQELMDAVLEGQPESVITGMYAFAPMPPFIKPASTGVADIAGAFEPPAPRPPVDPRFN